MDFNNLTPSEIAIAKVKCDNSLLYFTRFYFKLITGSKFIVNWHHKDLCKAIEQTFNYEFEFANFNIPPRHSKTEIVGVNSIAWGLSKNPSANFLYITGSDELRSDTSVRIRDIVTHPVYNKMYGIKLKKDQQGKNLWKTEQGGGLKTATIFGQITGFGAGRMTENKDLLNYVRSFNGAIILDDINKIIDALSDTANNQKANSILLNTIESRRNSPDTPIINIQQRAGLNDATATLLDFFKDSKIINIVHPAIKDNKALWPHVKTLDDLLRLKSNPKTKYTFDCQYQQRPTILEGVLFPENKLKRFSLSKFNYQNVTAKIGIIDVADSGTDFFAFPIFNKVKDLYYLVDVIYTNDDFTITKPLTLTNAIKHELDYIKVETNSQGKDFYRYLKNELQNTSIRGEFTNTNKETRILMQSDWILQNCYFRNDYEHGSNYDLFITDLTRYMKMLKNQRDDAPDSLAAFSLFIKRLFGQ